VRYRFDECLERGKIVKIPIDPALVEKELREAEADLAASEQSLLDLQEKWAIIQAYYSIFHAIRSQVFGKGYREKSHRCLKYARFVGPSSDDGPGPKFSPALFYVGDGTERFERAFANVGVVWVVPRR